MLAVLVAACHSSRTDKSVIVLGVDGMDPNFVAQHWNELPNLTRLRNKGGLTRLATTTPPQSPVAWSTFITGTDPAQHGLFDFVHRDPVTLRPCLRWPKSPRQRILSTSAHGNCRSLRLTCAPFGRAGHSGRFWPTPISP